MATGGPGVAGRCLGTLQAIIGHAKHKGLLEVRPTLGAKKLASKKKTRRLSVAEIEMLATGAKTASEAAEVRKAMAKGKGPQVLGGAIDPLKRMRDAVIPIYMPRKGTALEVVNPLANGEVLDQVETTVAIQRIAKRIGRPITREENRFVKGRWPDVMPEAQVEALVAQFLGSDAWPSESFEGLRAVGGARC